MARQITSMSPTSSSTASKSPRIAIPKSLLLGGVTGSLTLIAYILTIAPDLTWSNYGSDGGELITASITLGIAHPPGYPTYILLGKIFSYLPISTIAFRYNLFSAVAMAVAITFSASTAYEIVSSSKAAWAAALSAGLAFALSPLVWSQATITEVYALNLAILSILLWFLLTHRSPWFSGLMFGLAVTTHPTSLLMLPLSLALTEKRQRLNLCIGIAVGLLPLLVLPLLNDLGSPVIWGESSSLSGWWWLVSAQLYRANLQLPIFTTESLTDISHWSSTLLRQFAWIGWIFIVIGIIINKVNQRSSRWLIATTALYALFSIIYTTEDAIVNILPALLLLVPFLAAGLSLIGYWSLLMPVLLFALNYPSQNLRSEPQIRPVVEELFQEIPENAILLTPGDQSIFSLWYFQHVEGKRQDIRLVDENLLAFNWYRERLAVRYPDLDGLTIDDGDLFRQLNLQKRPLCDLALQTPEDMFCQDETITSEEINE